MIIKHAHGQYPVEFITLSELRNLVGTKKVITDANVAPALEIEARQLLQLTPGEETKNLGSYAACIDWLVDTQTRRSDQIYAIGGGVIGDLVGFVAATYMRGIPYVQVPTTLLAMVDSSVGGKVAVDHRKGKNLIGAFHAPSRVVISLDSLETLPKRQITNGIAEVLKYGFIEDASLLETAKPDEATVRRCIEIKAEIVESDEFETTGRRAVLNFGHTVGHAIEAITEYKELLHGEAIAIGMCVEARLGELLGISPKGTLDVVQQILQRHDLPIFHRSIREPELLIDRMKLDKKRVNDQLAFSLLTKIGGCKLFTEIHSIDVIRACEQSCVFGE